MYSRVKAILDSILQRDVVLEVPKDPTKGDFATTIAFLIAKEKKINVKEAANEIILKLKNVNEFQKVDFENGFINITINQKFIENIAKELLSYKPSSKNKSILLEYVSANPTGPLHIGHARGAIVGDILNKIGKYLGYKITTEYYINDAGKQIEALGYSIFLSGREILTLPLENTKEKAYKGEYILNLAKNAIDELGEKVFLSENNIPSLAEFGMRKMMELIKNTLGKVNIYFDSFISEKEIYENLDSILEKLKINNAIYEKDEKLWLKSSLKGDEKDRVVMKENKEPTYLAGDIAYHYYKFNRNFDYYINIWGADHHGYINRIKASIDFLGFESKKLEVILSQMVSILKDGKPYKMSKRAGNFILMENVIHDIGNDALRFIFITKKLDTHLEFDINIFKNEDASNPIYYINYANARIHTILSKSNKKVDFDFTGIDSNCRELLMLSLLFNRVLEDSFHNRALQKIPEYLKTLASKFHHYYNNSKIIGNENESKILGVLTLVQFAITKCFDLIGIEAKKKM